MTTYLMVGLLCGLLFLAKIIQVNRTAFDFFPDDLWSCFMLIVLVWPVVLLYIVFNDLYGD